MNPILKNIKADRKDSSGLFRYKPVVLWLTGLSGSGKSTLSKSLELELMNLGCRTFIIDGDVLRKGLCKDLGFSDSDRRENIRRVGELSRLFFDAGILTIVALISPFRADRDMVRKMFSENEFIEIYCSADMETCESRDIKGLYERARRGEIPNFTGISSPYEHPMNPELTINTSEINLRDSVKLVLKYLANKKVLNVKS